MNLYQGAVMEFLDTQLLVAASSTGDISRIHGRNICSMVANEFLDVHISDPVHARYYVRGLRTRYIDSLIVDFNNSFPSIREYNNQAMAMAINERRTKRYASAIRRLEKAHQRRLRRRFQMLIAAEITCCPIRQPDIETALGMLDQFIREHTLKANFRNSWNDLVILAASANANGRLITEDSLLARFAAKSLGGRVEVIEQGLALQFPETGAAARTTRRESKGYINRGWRLAMQQSRR